MNQNFINFFLCVESEALFNSLLFRKYIKVLTWNFFILAVLLAAFLFQQ